MLKMPQCLRPRRLFFKLQPADSLLLDTIIKVNQYNAYLNKAPGTIEMVLTWYETPYSLAKGYLGHNLQSQYYSDKWHPSFNKSTTQ